MVISLAVTLVRGAPVVALPGPGAVAAVEVEGVHVGEDHAVALFGQGLDLGISSVLHWKGRVGQEHA